MNVNNVKEGARLIREGMSKLDHGPLDYYLDRMAKCYEFLLTFAPHKVGDLVQLSKTPTITSQESWGWMGSKHFLKQGARARVAEVNCDGSRFSYYLVFDEDSWMDRDGREVPREPRERGHYLFSAGYVTAVSENDGH